LTRIGRSVLRLLPLLPCHAPSLAGLLMGGSGGVGSRLLRLVSLVASYSTIQRLVSVSECIFFVIPSSPVAKLLSILCTPLFFSPHSASDLMASHNKDAAAHKAEEAKGFGQQKAGEAHKASKDAAGTTQQKAHEAAGAAGDKANQAKQTASNAAGATHEKTGLAGGVAGEKWEQTKQASADAGQAASDKAVAAKDGASGVLQQAGDALGNAVKTVKDAVTPNK